MANPMIQRGAWAPPFMDDEWSRDVLPTKQPSNYLFWGEINMPGLDFVLCLPPLLGGLWAYGPAPGVELIPYFLGLAAWVGMAFLAILLAPFSALLRRLRGTKKTPPSEEPKNEEPVDKTM